MAFPGRAPCSPVHGLDPADVRRWRARRWFLSSPAPDVQTAVAANPPFDFSRAAYLSLFARVDRFDPEDLHRMVFDEGALRPAVLWRVGRLLVPFEVLPALFAAQEFSWGARGRRRRLDGHLNEQAERLAGPLAAALKEGPRPEGELVASIERARAPGDGAPTAVLDRLVGRGDLEMVRPVRSLAFDQVFYRRPSGPGRLRPTGLTDYAFLSALAGYYFRVCGPATRDDFALWSGVSLAAARKTLEDLAGILDEVDIEGERQAHFMLEEDAEELRGRAKPSTTRAVFLPSHDPAMTSFASGFAPMADARTAARLRLIPRRSREGLGRVNQPVLVGGRVVGSWDWSPKTRRVEVALVRELGPDAQAAVEGEAKRLDGFLEGELRRLPTSSAPEPRSASGSG